MKIFKDSTDKLWGLVTLAIVVLFLIIGISSFMGSDEGGISGWQTLKQEGAGFWVSSIILSALSGIALFFGIKVYDKNRDVKMLKPFLLAIVVFMSIAFGKGCTDKANDGVTTAKGRPVKILPDSNRIPAEDLLPKK